MPNWTQVGTGWAYAKSCFCVFSRPSYIGVLAKLEGILYPDHVRFHSCDPYIERLLTL